MKSIILPLFIFVLCLSSAFSDELILDDSFIVEESDVREADGKQANLAGFENNPVWQLTGEADMFLSWELPKTTGEGKIGVTCKILIPPTTVIQSFDGEKMKGVRLRFRLTDASGNSAISDRILSPGADWQTIKAEFADDRIGPYTLGLEMIWFEGPVFVDDLEVSGSIAEDPVTEEQLAMADWFHQQSWMIALRKKMPAGVSVSGEAFPDDEPGWFVVEVREFHSPDSGYDPNVAPMVGMFRVSPDKSEIQYMDPLSGEYGPLRPFLEARELW